MKELYLYFHKRTGTDTLFVIRCSCTMFNIPMFNRAQGEAGRRIRRRRPPRSLRKKTSHTPVKVRVFTLNKLILPGLLFAIYLFSYQFFFSVSLSTYSIYRINILYVLRYFG